LAETRITRSDAGPRVRASRQPDDADIIRRDTSAVTNGVTYDTTTFDTNKERPSRVSGPVRAVGTAGRGATPTPISGPLPLGYDGGHVLGLALGGANASNNVVPMYPRFNRGVWRDLERQLDTDATFLYSGLHAIVGITVNYAGPNDSVPASLSVSMTYDGKPTKLGKATRKTKNYGTWRQPGDIPRTGRLAAAAENVVSGVAAPSGGDVYTRAASYLKNIQGDAAGGEHLRKKHHLAPAARASYPDRHTDRPYEYLDILTFAGVVDPQTTFVDRGVFSARQRELILQTNMARNGGVLRSDDPADPAHLPPHNAATLDERGTFNAPEIDHIIPKLSGGSNSFSNARVVSWLLNNKEDRVKRISGLVDTTRLAPAVFPSSGTLLERAAAFLPDYVARLPGGFTADMIDAALARDYSQNVTSAMRQAVRSALADLVAAGDLALSGSTYTVP
jgi:hypothetical protein